MVAGPAFLLDVNVLLSLVWPFQQHHEKVRAWFVANAARHWATCPITEAGSVRLLSNPTVTPEALSVNDALQLLAANVQHPGHVFWPDNLDLSTSLELCGVRLQGHRQITDAYLLGLALHHGAHLVTLDASVAALLPPSARTATRVIDPLAGPR
ncbi:MAG: TA system VapC family ribonuclease toxin, partial [Acidobacteriaceae bacterium]